MLTWKFRPKPLAEAYLLWPNFRKWSLPLLRSSRKLEPQTPDIGTSNTHKTPPNYPSNYHPSTINTQLAKHTAKQTTTSYGLLPTPNLPKIQHAPKPQNGWTLSSKELVEKEQKGSVFRATKNMHLATNARETSIHSVAPSRYRRGGWNQGRTKGKRGFQLNAIVLTIC